MGSNGLTAFNASLESFSLFETEFENVEVVAALLNEEYDDAGLLTDTVDVTFRIIGRPGLFQVHPLYTVDWIAQAFVLIGLKHAEVEGIYQGLDAPAIIPQPTTPGGAPAPAPLPGPGVPVPA
jgi:hypothetical protein